MMRTLKGKISIIYLFLVLLTAVVGSASVLNLYRLSQSIDGLMTYNYKSINAASRMHEAVERQDGAVLIYLSVDKERGLELFTQNENEFSKWFNIENDNMTESGEKSHVDTIHNYYVQYQKLFSELQEIRNRQGVQRAAEFYDSTVLPVFNNIKLELRELSQLNEKAMFYAKEKANDNAVLSMYILLTLSMVAVIGGFFAAMYFTNRFLRPVASLTESVKRVKSGELKQQIEIRSGDEIGELAREFNNMTRRLQEYEDGAVGKLMAEKNKSLAIVKSIADPLIVLDNNYKISLLNKSFERFFEVKEEKVLNKHFLEAVRNGLVFDHIAGIAESKEEYKEKIMMIPSKEEHYFNIVVAMARDSRGKAAGIVAVFQNVTELKKLEKIRTDFIATISHEFKTPLTSIMMGASLLDNENIGALNSRQKDIVTTIQEDGERLNVLVSDLLELTRIESGKAVYRIQPCSISAIVENSVKPLYSLAERKEVNLFYEADEDLPKVMVDFEKIKWVINNLVTNALKYTNAGDDIAVSARVEQDKMVVSVRDTGVGIPEEYLDKIFNKFVQVKRHDLEVRGTGLGLSIVKEIVNFHNGEIWCESRIDAGSNFKFTLPLSE